MEVQTDTDGSVQTLRAMSGGGSGAGEHIAVAHALRGEGFDASEDGTGRGTPIVPVALDMREREEISWAVRRLTPRECERLQGFPDDYTNVPWRGKDQSPDGRRYKALGNSMAVNVMRWIGERIDLVNKLDIGK